MDRVPTTYRLVWPARLAELARAILSDGSPSRDEARSDAWLLLNSSIGSYLRCHCRQLGTPSREDLEDLAAEKSLDLLRRIEARDWEPGAHSGPEIAAYVSRVARNGLVDALRRMQRSPESLEAGPTERGPGNDRPRALRGEVVEELAHHLVGPEVRKESREYAAAIRRCAEELPPRSQRVWFLRVLCGLSSREIEAHPDLEMNRSHIDVILHRCRQQMTECMRRRDLNAAEMPPGTFVELWNALGGEGDSS